MKLTVTDNINLTYARTLCLIFFPGAKFSESEEYTNDTPCVNMSADELNDGISAAAEIKIGDKVEKAVYFRKWDKKHLKTLKIAVGAAFFECGAKFFGKMPPWGILTGVRPATVASKLIADNGFDKAREILIEEYFLNPQKAALVTEVSENQRRVIETIPNNSCSVYISIPFCPSRCVYCSFVSTASKKLLGLIPDYISALKSDITRTFQLINSLGLSVSSLYIGGGTPTVLDELHTKELLTHINSSVDVFSLKEFTLEGGRPDTITDEKLKIAKECGVTRLSVNPQTLNDEILKRIGRHHTADEFFRAYEIAANSGIPHINTDLIAGLPDESYESFKNSVDGVISLSPDNITVHTFCVKKAADILRETDGENIYSRTETDIIKSVEYSQSAVAEAGYFPYYMYRQKNTAANLENVGFSKKDCEGLYNIIMMEEVHSVFGIGAGAVTKFVSIENTDNEAPIKRIFEPKYPYEYLREVSDGSADKRFEEIRKLGEKILK